MPELATGNPRICPVGRRVDEPSVDRVGHYGFVSNIEGYHGLGHGRIQNYLGGLGCRPRESESCSGWGKETKKRMEGPTIAQDVEFCHTPYIVSYQPSVVWE